MHPQLDILRQILRTMDTVLVAFSGGVDSALVLRVAHEELGARALALTADSPTFPPEERDEARRFATAIGARHLIVDAHELEREGYARNSGDRCYFCKSELFDLARDVAARHALAWVVDGTIVDDLGAHRPGLRAAQEHGVRHPLVEAGFTKRLVRETAQALGMPVWDKPSFACLGSRFAVGTRVTLDRVTRVGRVETALRALGFRQFRVRFHLLGGESTDASGPGLDGTAKGSAAQTPERGELLRIEVDVADIGHLVAPGVREALVAACRAEGFPWITLDLEGYRTGSTSGTTRPTPAT
jgi:uncharacterized protein